MAADCPQNNDSKLLLVGHSAGFPSINAKFIVKKLNPFLQVCKGLRDGKKQKRIGWVMNSNVDMESASHSD
jgi:hypothetical protein